MRTHIHLCVGSFCAITITLLCLILRLDFKEDISAFLPFEGKQHESFQVYQDISGANKLIAIFQNKFQENIDNKTRILYNGVEIKTKRSAIYGN